MQEHHVTFLVEIKEHPRNSVLGQVRPHPVNTTAHGTACRHPHRPAKLNRLDVFADTSSRKGRLFSHSQTGSPPASVRPKTACTTLPCLRPAGSSLSSACDWLRLSAEK